MMAILNGFTPVLSSVFIGPLDSLFIHAVTESFLADGVIFGIDLIS